MALRSIPAWISVGLASGALVLAQRTAAASEDPSAALLTHLQEQRPVLLLADDSVPCGQSVGDFDQIRSLSDADRALITHRFASESTSAADLRDFCEPGRCKPITKSELRALTADDGDGDPANNWEPVRRRYGEGSVIAFGTVAIESDKALTCYRASSGLLAGGHFVVLLRKEGVHWVVAEEAQVLVE